jgi:histidine phosphotransfer protein HptB
MIDWDRVTELRAEVGEDDFAEVVLLFLEEADEVADRLEQTTAPDAAQIARDLHSLKGAALNLGFAQLADHCQEGERRARGGDVAIDLQIIARCYHESKASFQLALTQSAA